MLILIFFLGISVVLFSQIAINTDGSEAKPGSILHVKSNQNNAFLIENSTGYIGINNLNPQYRLHLKDTVNDSRNYGYVLEVTGGSNDAEVYVGTYSLITGTGGVNRAFEGFSNGINLTGDNPYNIGLSGFAANGRFNYGVQGQVTAINTDASGQNSGVVSVVGGASYYNIGNYAFTISNGDYNMGVYTFATVAGSGANYGIYSAGWNTGSGSGWAGYFYGDVNVVGDLYVSGTINNKSSQQPLDEILKQLDLLETISFQTEKGNLSYGYDFESVQNIFPELVTISEIPSTPEMKTDIADESFAINYGAVIPLLTKGIQELTDRVEQLEIENERLKQQINEGSGR